MAGDRHDGCLRHAFRLRIGLSVEPHPGDERSPRPDRYRARNRRAISARQQFRHFGRICRIVPPHLGGTGAGHGWRRSAGGPAVKATAPIQERYDRLLRIALPIVVLAFGLLLWEAIVRVNKIPPYILPSPSLILRTLIDDWELLSQSLVVTLATTVEGFLLAAVGGVGLAVLFNQSRLLEYSLYPYAVILQVTPVVAIAPLLLIYLPQPAAVLACAWIVAFFPVLANTTLGLNSVDRHLADGFDQ